MLQEWLGPVACIALIGLFSLLFLGVYRALLRNKIARMYEEGMTDEEVKKAMGDFLRTWHMSSSMGGRDGLERP